MSLHLAPTVDVPLDLATESNALLGKKGSGKTNALIVLVEELHAAGVPVVSIDPKGDHWGIRAGADGKAGKGLPIPVFGGLHGDIPLEPTAGTVIATLIRDRNLSVVLDVSEFTGGERRRFLTDFATGLYRHPSREPMHLVLEEAHEYIPQRVDAGDSAMVGAFEKLVKLGRYKGLGVTMASQRSASLNKNVLTQVDNLVMLRMLAPQDRTAVRAWIDTHADPGSIIDTLPSLLTGEAWLWQPERGEPIRFRFRQRRTFDAGATPKPGEQPRPPATLADIDLGEVTTLMADTIERAKADDPKALRATIARLEKQLADQPTPEPIRVEVPVLSEADRLVLAEIDGMLKGLAAALPSYTAIRTKIHADPTTPTPPNDFTFTDQPPPAHAANATLLRGTPRRRPTDEYTLTRSPRSPRSANAGETRIGKAERSILTVLAQRGLSSDRQIATLAGYSSKGGGFRNALSALRSAGYIIGSGQSIDVTTEGVEALGPYEPLPTGRALLDYWLNHRQLGKAERLILDYLAEQYPSQPTQEDVATATGYQPDGGGFRNAISKLRSLELITGHRNALAVNDELGEAAHS